MNQLLIIIVQLLVSQIETDISNCSIFQEYEIHVMDKIEILERIKDESMNCKQTFQNVRISVKKQKLSGSRLIERKLIFSLWRFIICSLFLCMMLDNGQISILQCPQKVRSTKVFIKCKRQAKIVLKRKIENDSENRHPVQKRQKIVNRKRKSNGTLPFKLIDPFHPAAAKREKRDFQLHRTEIYKVICDIDQEDRSKMIEIKNYIEKIRLQDNLSNGDILEILTSIDPTEESSALHISAKNVLLDTSQFLIQQYPALAACKDKFLRTPLHYSAASDIMLLNEIILEYGGEFVDINAIDVFLLTPLQLATSLEAISSVEYLIKQGAKIKPKVPNPNLNYLLTSALHTAAAVGSVQAIRLMLPYIQSVDIFDANGESPLLYAVKSNSYNAAKLLIEHGSCTSIRNRFNKNPLDLSSKSTAEMHVMLNKAFETEFMTGEENRFSRKRRAEFKEQDNRYKVQIKDQLTPLYVT
ncbi:hypothetical protein ACOME3_004344 [Neoechinorhynchus agilis]